MPNKIQELSQSLTTSTTNKIYINRLTKEIISGHAHLGNNIDSVFLSNNGGRFKNVAMA